MIFFFFNDTATTEIYTLSLHDALPIYCLHWLGIARCLDWLLTAHSAAWGIAVLLARPDRKSTRLNSSHGYISYAVFCLKKKKISFPVIVPSTTAAVGGSFECLRSQVIA